MSRLPTQNSIVDYSIWLLWLAGLFLLLFFANQSDFLVVGGGYTISFLAYFLIIKHPYDKRGFVLLLALAILIRIIAVFAFPSLSDDIYRFVWDGRLAIAGHHPFEHLPSYYLEAGNEVAGITQSLFDQLNSQDYYTIYPTISQTVFALAAWIAPDSIYGFSLVLKGSLAAMDIASIYLLYRILQLLDLDETKVKWYALNPLVIVEISGNAHFEGAMIFFMLLAIFLLIKKKMLSALALSLSVLSKLIPLIFLPLLFAVVDWKNAIKYCVFTGLSIIVIFFSLKPFGLSGITMDTISHLSESVNLYFQKFEFNGSIYYIVRWIGYQVKGWNIIADAGPILGLIVFVSIWILTWFNRNSSIKDLPRLMLWSLVIYFVFATTVHPWYLTTLVALAAICRYRFVLLWSALITLTYVNYSFEPFSESLWIVAMEYLLVLGMLIFEIKKYNFNKDGIESQLGSGISSKV